MADKKFNACLIGDPSRLKQILFNLVDNAVKFTEKGSVTLECKTQYENAELATIEISVADTGIGIQPDRLKEIFKPFTQADGSITRKYGGTGLGLTICNKLICLMGGHGLMVESFPGAGSRFYFYMHFAKAECAENFRPRTFSRSADALCDPAVDPQSIRVLVAEDDPVNAFLMTRFLEMLNYKFKIVANGLEALEESKNSSFDIIFMDVHMSELNGIEAAAKIREFDKTIPIIACTADTARADIEACLEAGMQSYIFKPFELNDIIQSINTFIRPA
jgi:CheY-like chemotaxis protein